MELARACSSAPGSGAVVGARQRRWLGFGGGSMGPPRLHMQMRHRAGLVVAFAQSGREADGSGSGSSSGSGNNSNNNNTSIQLYGQIEKVIAESAKRSQGEGDGRWREVQGAWVLGPSKGEGSAAGVVHFVGGVFVGATPQLTYRLFLERLAERGFLIIATPFASGFDHLRIADEVQFKFDRAVREVTRDLALPAPLPVFGVGHSLGALTQLLIGARYAVERAGNVFLSFNNKEATTSIPLLAPLVVPMAQNLGPLLIPLTSSPQLRMGAEMALRQLQSLSPPLVKQVLPLVEQLPPLYSDLANGKDRFVPSPEDTSRLIKTYYGVGRNLLVRFKDDSIDETLQLAQTLGSDSAVSAFLDMSVRTLPGDHGRPLQQVFPQVPPGVADAVSRGSRFLESITAGTPLADVVRGVSDSASSQLREQIVQDVDKLVDEIAAWMLQSLKLNANTRFP